MKVNKCEMKVITVKNEQILKSARKNGGKQVWDESFTILH